MLVRARAIDATMFDRPTSASMWQKAQTLELTHSIKPTALDRLATAPKRQKTLELAKLEKVPFSLRSAHA